MRQPSPDFTRLQYLSDTLRRRFPGFVDDGANVTHKSSPDDPGGQPGQRRLEEAIRTTFARSIPQHPAYSAQILYALRTFRANNIGSMKPAENANDD